MSIKVTFFNFIHAQSVFFHANNRVKVSCEWVYGVIVCHCDKWSHVYLYSFHWFN